MRLLAAQVSCLGKFTFASGKILEWANLNFNESGEEMTDADSAAVTSICTGLADTLELFDKHNWKEQLSNLLDVAWGAHEAEKLRACATAHGVAKQCFQAIECALLPIDVAMKRQPGTAVANACGEEFKAKVELANFRADLLMAM